MYIIRRSAIDVKKRHVQELDRAIVEAETKGFVSRGDGGESAELSFRFCYDDSKLKKDEETLKTLREEITAKNNRYCCNCE